MTDEMKACRAAFEKWYWSEVRELSFSQARQGWEAAFEYMNTRPKASEEGAVAAVVHNQPWPHGVVPVPSHGRSFRLVYVCEELLPHGTKLYTTPCATAEDVASVAAVMANDLRMAMEFRRLFVSEKTKALQLAGSNYELALAEAEAYANGVEDSIDAAMANKGEGV